MREDTVAYPTVLHDCSPVDPIKASSTCLQEQSAIAAPAAVCQAALAQAIGVQGAAELCASRALDACCNITKRHCRASCWTKRQLPLRRIQYQAGDP